MFLLYRKKLLVLFSKLKTINPLYCPIDMISPSCASLYIIFCLGMKSYQQNTPSNLRIVFA